MTFIKVCKALLRCTAGDKIQLTFEDDADLFRHVSFLLVLEAFKQVQLPTKRISELHAALDTNDRVSCTQPIELVINSWKSDEVLKFIRFLAKGISHIEQVGVSATKREVEDPRLKALDMLLDAAPGDRFRASFKETPDLGDIGLAIMLDSNGAFKLAEGHKSDLLAALHARLVSLCGDTLEFVLLKGWQQNLVDFVALYPALDEVNQVK